MKIQDFFIKLGRLPGVGLAQGDFIPTQGKDEPPSLYINIIYRGKSADETDSKFLDCLRECAVRVMSETEEQLKAERFNSLCVSFFHIPTPGSNMRIYRAHPLRAQIKDIVSGAMSLDAIEESRHPDLRKLIDAERKS